MTEPMFRVCPLHAKHAEVRLAKSFPKAVKLAREMLERRDEEVALYSPEGSLLRTFI